MAPIPDPLPLEVLDAIQRGNAIEAIKLLRASSGLSLKEAKDVVDNHRWIEPARAGKRASAPSLLKAVADALRADDPEAALRAMREKMGRAAEPAKVAIVPAPLSAPLVSNGLAPGEVPKSNNRLWLAAVFVAVVLILHLAFG